MKWDLDLLTFGGRRLNFYFMGIFFQIKSVPTKPIEGQKTGTSGLRKKVFSFGLLMRGRDHAWWSKIII